MAIIAMIFMPFPRFGRTSPTPSAIAPRKMKTKALKSFAPANVVVSRSKWPCGARVGSDENFRHPGAHAKTL